MRLKIRVKNEKKALIISFIFIIAIIFLYCNYVFSPILQYVSYTNQIENFAKNNSEPIFKIGKVVLYSSADAVDSSEGEILRDLDISQYTDIAIYIDNKSYIQNLSNKNTVSELYIDSIKINLNSNKGTQSLNYKNPFNFGKYSDYDENKSRIDFNILHTNQDNEQNDFSNPTFFTDCSNPITLSYLNKNVKKNCEITKNNETVDFNGKLLKLANIPISDISYNLNFKIHLKNSLEQSFVYNVDLNMPLKDKNSSIYDGYILSYKYNSKNPYYFLKEN